MEKLSYPDNNSICTNITGREVETVSSIKFSRPRDLNRNFKNNLDFFHNDFSTILQKIIQKQSNSKFNILHSAKLREIFIYPKVKTVARYQKQARDANIARQSLQKSKISINQITKPFPFSLNFEKKHIKKTKFQKATFQEILHKQHSQNPRYLGKFENYKAAPVVHLSPLHAQYSRQHGSHSKNSSHSKKYYPPYTIQFLSKKNIPTLSKLRANILYTTSNFAQGACPQENATLKKAPFFLKKNHLQFQHKNFFENKKSNSIKIFKHSIPHKKSNINYVTPKKFLYLSSLTRSFADYVIQKRNVQLPIHLFDKHLTVIPRVIKRIRASRATYKKSTTTKQKNSSIFSSIFRNKLRTARDHFVPIPYQPLAYSTSQLRATDDLKTINPKISHEFLRNSYNFPQIMHMEHSNFQNQKFSTVYQPSISEFADAVTSHLINGLSAAPTNSTLSWPQAVPSYPGWHA